MNQIHQGLIKVLREFGIVGLVTYVGGVVILFGFLQEKNDFNRQILLGIVGLILLIISTFIAYFRIKIQRDREQALIDMTKNIGNRLAEQLGKNMSKEQVETITQKIRQNQRDLIEAILGKISNDENKQIN